MSQGATRRTPRLRHAMPLAVALTLATSGTALADITGTVRNPNGAPLPGVTVEALDATGVVDATDFSTDSAGAYVLTTASLSGPPPYTIRASETDSCREFTDPARTRTVTSGAVPNPATVDLTLDLLGFCEATPSSSEPAQTAYIDLAGQRILGGPGGRAYIRVPTIPFGATSVSVLLPDGRAIGGPGAFSGTLALTLPTAAYTGAFQVSYIADGVAYRYNVGTIVSRIVGRVPAAPGRFDLMNIVDVSGSMAGSDPSKRRADAIDLVLDLSVKGDKVGAVGFDDSARSIFELSTITGPAKAKALGKTARRKIGNFGGTDYDAGFRAAYAKLIAPSVSQTRPKAVVFLTDGGHGGTYENTHLLFANNPSGRTWPICVVQLGRSAFNSGDVARLKRIAKETGGIFVKTPTNAELTNLYFRCRGSRSGEKTIGTKRWVLSKGQTRALVRKVPKGLKRATFFVGWDKGTFNVTLVAPNGRAFSAARRAKNVKFNRGRSYAFFTVTKPRTGRWRLSVRAVRATGKQVVSSTITGSNR